MTTPPTIPPAEMGDVWPRAEPGTEGDYGHAVWRADGPCEVRSFRELTLTYTVGRYGLDDTGAIRLALRWVADCGALQTDQPGEANWITAHASSDVPLEVCVEPYGYRPWSLAIRVTVLGGYLRPGEEITVVMGDRSGGGPGFRIQTIAEAAWELKVSVDACATGQFAPLAPPLTLAVLPGPPATWHGVLPSQRRPGEAFSLGLRSEDRWGNPTPSGGITLGLDAPGIAGLPPEITLEARAQATRIDGLTAPEGIHQIRITGPGGLLATSNPVRISDATPAWWGDLHGQSGETVGIGTIEEYMHFARDLAFLDVCGHQGNDFQITNAFWEKINQVTASWTEEG
ncbi:MAG: DUF3604 domain-containing protein, partial [Pseudomonadota bacterium]